MILTALTSFIVKFSSFWIDVESTSVSAIPAAQTRSILDFELRHRHAVSSTARVVFSDVSSAQIYSHNIGKAPYRVQTRPVTSHKPPSFGAYSQARIRSIRYGESYDLPWDEDVTVGPNVEIRETLLELAKMTNNAYVQSIFLYNIPIRLDAFRYVEPDDPAWYDLGGNWTEVQNWLKIMTFEI